MNLYRKIKKILNDQGESLLNDSGVDPKVVTHITGCIMNAVREIEIVVEVTRGCAEVTKCPDFISVQIIDHDAMEESPDLNNPALDIAERGFTPEQ